MRGVHQIVFNEISAGEISAIPTLEQLELVNSFKVDENDLKGKTENTPFGIVQRDGRKIYRFRSKDYRIYFTLEDDKVIVQRVLHTNSLRIFSFGQEWGVGRRTSGLARRVPSGG